MDSTERFLVKPLEYGQYWKGFDETFLIWTVLKGFWWNLSNMDSSEIYLVKHF